MTAVKKREPAKLVNAFMATQERLGCTRVPTTRRKIDTPTAYKWWERAPTRPVESTWMLVISATSG